MLNEAIGERRDRDGQSFLTTNADQHGHAIYGPYLVVKKGLYVVLLEAHLYFMSDAVDDIECAVMDVAADTGRTVIARRTLSTRDLARTDDVLRLEFQLDEPKTLEFRLEVFGNKRLVVSDMQRLIRIQPGVDLGQLIRSESFPRRPEMTASSFLHRCWPQLRDLYRRGAAIEVRDADAVVTIAGVSFLVREMDDLRFVDEVFFRNAYNVYSAAPCCVIDIGLNIGLVSLTFAIQDCVKEVHAFELMPDTYQRALHNISINENFSAKIHTYNVGLADDSLTKEIRIGSHGDSGQNSIYGNDIGKPVSVAIARASDALRPIIEAARSKDLRIYVKVDCEGAEFAIFEDLAGAGLLADVDLFMVEWHRIFDGRDHEEMVVSLNVAGFAVIDQTNTMGNCFFYAARLAR